MLTRLKVSGFKNLVDIDVRFGAFTCIAGANAVGKSNLFDAISFLSRLADEKLLNAALAVRSEVSRTSDVRSLFHRVNEEYAEKISFEAEMIIPTEGIDDLGQKAEASITFVRYKLEIGYKEDDTLPTLGSLKLLKEQLEQINITDAKKHLPFPHKVEWFKSVIKGRRGSPFISTIEQEGKIIIKLSQDGQQGRSRSFLASDLPRTVISTVNAIENPTALLARREMQSWKMLQLEPGALREPDRFTTSPGLQTDGSHLPATLYYLARQAEQNPKDNRRNVYASVASRLSQLIEGVIEVKIDRDQQRELLTLMVKENDKTMYPAKSLSDGTLRFLALTVLDLDQNAKGLICMEEPENGIHPARIPAILTLLQDIACELDLAVDDSNPLRQVIINTHSPVVVSQVPENSLLVADLKKTEKGGKYVNTACFSWLDGTWRAKAEPSVPPVSMGKLLSYLNLHSDSVSKEETSDNESKLKKPQAKQTNREPSVWESVQMKLFTDDVVDGEFEAWLMFDERAIREAADNPSGKEKLSLHPLNDVENITDPKEVIQ
ncbi:MAG: AAA family ATPase [Blastocatellia bacterium]|nr:AAA family ATPase [Blastocatellia bacterium]